MRRNNAHALWVVALGFLTIAGCPQKDNSGKDESGGQLLTKLEINQALWKAAGIDSYEYRYRRLCFCAPDTIREVMLRISSGTLVSGAYVDDGSAVAMKDLSNYPTVEGLFAIIEMAMQQGADSVVVEYHADLGYPTQIAIDRTVTAADDEVTYVASSLVVQP